MHLDRNDLSSLNEYLKLHQLLKAGETVVSAEKPGEGNMNYVLRVNLPNRSIIVKQARPYVEKYPSIPAPEERVIIEGEFYKKVSKSKSLSSIMPALINVDKENHIIILEDVGQANDFTFLYNDSKNLNIEEAKALSMFLTTLHNSYKASGPDELMANRKLRALNHEHIFVYPLMFDNGFNLDTVQPGLQKLALPFKQNEALKTKAKLLGEIYLGDGGTLLHGDYYPGSWLKTLQGVKVIDPEFCFYGAAEFDLGVMIAHLKIAQQPHDVIEAVDLTYEKAAGFSEALFNEFTGIEIIRRIIGLAQLPLTLSIIEKEALLNEALDLLSI